MKKLITLFQNNYKDYKEYRASFLHNQIKGMMILTGLITLYALLAPILIGNVYEYTQKVAIHREFTVLAVAGGIPFIGFSIIFSSKKISGNIKGILYELLMFAVFFSCALVYPLTALNNSKATGDYADYTVFYIISLIVLITFVMYPLHFILCYGICSVIMVQVVKSLALVSPKPVYNLILFCVATTVMYYIKYLSRFNLFRKGLQLIKIQKEREQFMIALTHEMRTPLNSILGKNQMIMADTAEIETRRLSKQINGSGRMLLSLINDILDQAKLVMGKMNLVESEYRADRMFEEIGSIVRSMAEEHGLEYIEEIDEKIPRYLYGDEIRIKQIILNLLSNAVKYTHSGSVTLRATFDNECMLKVSVIDTGIGIKEEDLPKLNQTFVRIDEQKNRSIQGTGLGLSISTSLLKLMNSKLDVNSVYGQGSTFGFSIYQKIIEHDADAVIDNVTSNVYPHAKILIVDDNHVNITVLKGLLTGNSIAADFATSGAECISKVMKRKYDIIFLDHMMPELDGVETLKKLRSEYAEHITHTKIIALTANYDSNAREVYEGYGFDAYIAKPIELQALNILLNRYLSN